LQALSDRTHQGYDGQSIDVERVTNALSPRQSMIIACLAVLSCLLLPGQAAQFLHAAPPEQATDTVQGGSTTVPQAGAPADDLAEELAEGEVGRLVERFSYAAIIAVLLLCGLGLPLPEEVPILVSGVLSRTGHLQPWPALLCVMFGVLAGDSIMFLLGRRWGSHVFDHRLARRMLTPERRVKIEAAFAKYGAWIVFVARFLPGLRAPLFLTAGSMKTSFWVFLGMDGAAALVSIPISFWVAYVFTDKLQEVLDLSHQVLFVIVAIVLAALVAGHFLWERRKEEKLLVKGAELLDTKVADLGRPHSGESLHAPADAEERAGDEEH
jgi:membrane protein DedA with SNARE-associated domain